MQPTKTDSSKETEAHHAIEKARKEGANLLLPTTNVGGLSEFHAPVIDSVFLSPRPSDGDVYPASSGEDCNEFRISAQGLRKLSVCAGIIWHPYECRRLDSRADKFYVAYQAMGGIRKADGTPVWWKGEYDIDFEIIEEELYAQYQNTCKNWKKPDDVKQGYVESSVRRDMIFKRKHKIKLAETGAMNRVVRAILGLKGSYTKAELAKPFVMVRIVLRPDFKDPVVRKQLLDAAVKSMTGVYGPEYAQPTPVVPDLDGDIIDIPPPDTEEPDEPDDDSGIPGAGSNGNPPDPREVFEGLAATDQEQHLKELSGKKGYDLKNLKFPIEQFTQKHRLDLFVMLSGMADAKEDDDIPF